MNFDEIYDVLAKEDVLKESVIKELVEFSSYGSMGTLNRVVDLLEIIKRRIDVGQKIEYKGEYLTLKSFAELIDDNFTKYVLKSVFAKTILEEKVYFNLENTEEGLDLVYTGNKENKLFKWIADIDKQFCFMRLLPTNVVYIRDNINQTYIPYISEHNSCYVYDEKDGKIKEVGI